MVIADVSVGIITGAADVVVVEVTSEAVVVGAMKDTVVVCV